MNSITLNGFMQKGIKPKGISQEAAR